MMRSVVVSMCTSAFCISAHSNSNERSGPYRTERARNSNHYQ